MARTSGWQEEIEEARRQEVWSLTPPNRIVKAVPMGYSLMQRVTGYVTIERSLLGRTPRQMEVELGLPEGKFAQGCRVYALTRLPMTHEIEYELTARYPDGLAFVEASAQNEMLLRELDPSRPVKEIYGPGRNAIHQWRLTTELPAAVVATLAPNAPYPYLRR